MSAAIVDVDDLSLEDQKSGLTQHSSGRLVRSKSEKVNHQQAVKLTLQCY